MVTWLQRGVFSMNSPLPKTGGGLNFHAKLQCFVHAICYDFSDTHGTVWVDEGGCTDMGGCIAFFLRIDPHVKTITTYSGWEKDTTYVRKVGAEWEARMST